MRAGSDVDSLCLVRAWRTRGYYGIVRLQEPTGKPPGQPPALGDADRAVLKSLLEARDHWETTAVRDLIVEHRGITLSLSRVCRILRHRLKMQYPKPYPHDLRRPTDAEEQLEDRLIDAFNTLMDRGIAESDIALGFLDEASPQLTANTARVWHFEKAVIQKNTAKLKANAIGLYGLLATVCRDSWSIRHPTPLRSFCRTSGPLIRSSVRSSLFWTTSAVIVRRH